jgi:hypothetical protein
MSNYEGSCTLPPNSYSACILTGAGVRLEEWCLQPLLNFWDPASERLKRTVGFWEGWEILIQLEGPAFSPDNKGIISSSSTREFKSWYIDSGDLARTIRAESSCTGRIMRSMFAT